MDPTTPAPGKRSLAKQFLLAAVAFVPANGALHVALSVAPSGAALAAETAAPALKRYRNGEWRFELDLPSQWEVARRPKDGRASEIARFLSHENGTHLLIVHRNAHDPSLSARKSAEQLQETLAKAGYSNFAHGETKIGSRRVATLEFSKVGDDGKMWYCRHYLIIDGTLAWLLGFGTSDRDRMFDTIDRMAKSFTYEDL